jgi:hypothetical protein
LVHDFHDPHPVVSWVGFSSGALTR